ncbi:MAG TPA: sulfatase [Saprospiraceae bacterium]|nr:sulfatase [Saprospiraceae bacterium]
MTTTIKLPYIALVFVLAQAAAMAQNRPNVVCIIVDDLGYHDLACTGSSVYKTPNIDQLASQSVVFQKAYANYPRCVPSRYALLTAQYPMRNQQVPDDGFFIGEVPQERNVVMILKNKGYRTAFLGKWHLGDGSSSPDAFGFDVSVAAGKAGSPMSYFYPFNEPKGSNRNVRKESIEDLDEMAKPGDYLTDVLTGEYLKFLQQIPSGQPFFAVLSFYAVHQPLEARPEDVEANKRRIAAHDFGNGPEYIAEGTGRTKMRQDNPVYAAMVENMDWNVGRIMDYLRASGLEQNTIVVFTSDHGGLSNDGHNRRQLATSNAPLRAGKGWMYEGGLRVPLMFRYPGVLKPRLEKQSVVMLMDLFPTLLDMTIQARMIETDGRSFWPVLQNLRHSANRELFWHASQARPNNTGESPTSAMRKGPWKLIDYYESDTLELYHLDRDPSEKHNLAAQFPKKTSYLKKRLDRWKQSRQLSR